MRAIVIDGCCEADALRVTEIPKPEARPGWVLIRVHVAGLNHSEVILRKYEADRDYINTPIVPGIECAGTVADPSDTDLRQGERVVAMMGGMGRSFNGSYAEYTLVPRSHVFRVNTYMDWKELGALPETYYTAYGSLCQGLMVGAGDTLLVRGATSALGRAAVQLGKAMGATVVAACRHEDAFRGLSHAGADHCVVDDGALSKKELPARPNKILELVGVKTLDDSLRTVSRPGYVCNTGNLGGVYALDRFDPIKGIPNGVFLSSFYSNDPTQEAIDAIIALLDGNGLKPLWLREFYLEEVWVAHDILERGSGGKCIVDCTTRPI